MLLSLLGSIAGLGSSSGQALEQTVTATPITITQDNVELYGAGTFGFTPDKDAFDVAAPPGGRGERFVLRVWFNPAGLPVGCDVGRTELVDAARTGCAQLMREARFKLLPGMDGPYRRGFVDVKFSFFTDPPGGPAGRMMFALPEPGYGNVVVKYPPQDAATVPLDPAAGRLMVSIQPDDYPPIALRNGLESASTMLIGIDQSGSVKSCRPFGEAASRTTFLDNHTCGLILTRARFKPVDGAEQYDGIRYLKQTMHWRLPR